MALFLLLASCRSERPASVDGDEVDDTSSGRPSVCGDGPVAREFYGDAPSEVVTEGTTLVARWIGPGSGIGVRLGLTVDSPTPNVAWRVDLVDVANEVRVGGSVPGDLYSFSALRDWSAETCMGHLEGVYVCLGDDGCLYQSEQCDFDGQTLRLDAVTTTIGGSGIGEPQLSVEVVLDASVLCSN